MGLDFDSCMCHTYDVKGHKEEYGEKMRIARPKMGAKMSAEKVKMCPSIYLYTTYKMLVKIKVMITVINEC